MPDQNNPLNQTASPQGSPVATTPAIEEITVPFGMGNSGSPSASTPSDLPPIISSAGKTQKFGGKKIIATILGLFLLVGGLAAGTILVRQKQEIREKAAGGTGISATSCAVAAGQTSCQGSYSWDFDAELDTNYEIGVSVYDDNMVLLLNQSINNIWHTPSCRDNKTNCESDCSCDCDAGGNSGTCAGKCGYPRNDQFSACAPHANKSNSYTLECGKKYIFRLNRLDSPTEIGFTDTVQANGCQATTPPITGQCQNVKVYNTSWVEITNFSSLKAGDHVRFAVSSSATGGSFDKARFTINGTLRPDVTQKKPNSEEFFDEYTIPAGTTNFTIKGEVHHTTLGWF